MKASALALMRSTGVVTTNADFAADYENTQSQSFTVVATDAAGNASEQVVSVAINNLDEVAPSITSGDTATAIDENSGEGQVVYTATASDTDFNGLEDITFILSDSSDPALSIDSVTGEVTLSTDPNHEVQPSYNFAVIATDAAGNVSEAQSVTLDINDLDDTAPSITSGDTGSSVDENSGAGQVIYTAIAVDSTDVVDTPTADNSNDTGSAVSTVTVPDLVEATQHVYVSSSTKSEDGTQETIVISYNAEDTTTTGLGIRVHFDSSAININGISDIFQNGLLSASSDPDADDDNRDGDTNTDQFVTFAWVSMFSSWPNSAPVDLATITFDVDEDATGTSAINFTASSNASGFDFDGQTHNLALTAAAEVQASPITFSLADESLGFSIDADGVVTTNASFEANYEDAQSQSFTVVATDVAGNASEQVVNVAINNLDEVAPSITSGDTGTAVNENSGEGQVVYTATATDDADTSDGVTFSLADESLGFSIDADTGVVTTNDDFAADYENTQSQSFTVVATDAAGNASEQVVSVAINNLDEVAPSITSGDTGTAVDENSGADQVVYTATASDTDFNGLEDITFSLADDSLGFSIDADTGVVTTNADFAADYEDAQSQSFTVVATDVAGNASEQVVSVAINNLDEVAPSITSGDTATAVNENSGEGQVVYTATGDR
jgi:hypothetical protein